MSDEPKPCPFCGATNPSISMNENGYWIVECWECNAQSCACATREEVFAAWNRRATPTVKVEWTNRAYSSHVSVGKYEAIVGRYAHETSTWAEVNHIGTCADHLWYRDGFPTADDAKRECERRLALLVEATKGEGT